MCPSMIQGGRKRRAEGIADDSAVRLTRMPRSCIGLVVIGAIDAAPKLSGHCGTGLGGARQVVSWLPTAKRWGPLYATSKLKGLYYSPLIFPGRH